MVSILNFSSLFHNFCIQASSASLPSSFPKTEIGLMTKIEFLDFRNPKSQFHPDNAYDFTVFEMNRDYPKWTGEVFLSQSKIIKIHELSGGFCGYNTDDKLVIVIHDGTLYYEHPSWIQNFPKGAQNWTNEEKDLNIQSKKQVKYLSELMPLISPIAKKNENEFPVILI